MSPMPRGHWILTDRRGSMHYVLLSGLAWGLVVTTFESLSQPPLELSVSDYFNFYSRILLHYGAAGILLAWLTFCISKIDGPLRKRIAVFGAIAAATSTALLIDWLSIKFVPLWRDGPMAAMWQFSDLGVHMAWLFSVYGGLYMAAFFLLRTEALSRERLRLAELERLSAEARMERSLAEMWAPAVAPDLLLRSLSELASRYNDNDRGADRLLDILVRLLRSASAPTPQAIPDSGLQRHTPLAPILQQLRGELGLADEPSTDGASILQEEANHDDVDDHQERHACRAGGGCDE